MKKFSIVIKPEISELDSKIINEYWEIRDNKLQNSPREISAKYSLELHVLINKVKENSKCIFEEGNCKDCQKRLTREVYSHTSFNSIIKMRPIVTCSRCSQIEYDRESEERKLEEIYNITKKLELGIQSKNWKKLTENEFDILKQIIEYKDKKTIIKHLFKGDFYDKKIWRIVNKIEKLGLIYVNRDDFSSVISFDFYHDLKEKIKADPVIKETLLNFLNLTMTENQSLLNSKYSGSFTLKKSVLFKAGVKYFYTGWENSDGSINIQIYPYKNHNHKEDYNS